MSDYPIENKVAKSGLIVLEMDDLVPDDDPIEFDLKDLLWEGIALKEKDFRAFLEEHDWSKYEGKSVAVHCSVDAIIPNWAFMLVATKLRGVTHQIYFAPISEAKKLMVREAIDSIDTAQYEDARVIIKGCGKKTADFSAYGHLTQRLQPVVKTIMFGEPCSTVPVYKKKKPQ
jgi:hypothetical protein